MQRKTTITIAALAFGALAIPAIAAPIADTLLTHGYDDTNHNLVVGVSVIAETGDTGPAVDCTVADGTYTYEVGEDGKVSTLKDANGQDVEFEATGVTTTTTVGDTTTTTMAGEPDGDEAVTTTHEEPDGDEPTGDTPQTVTVKYGSDEAGDCTLSVIDVTGPNGQVNHGTVVSAFVHALHDMGIKGGGCLVRLIAHTDYGKGDQQVKVGDTTGSTMAPPASDATPTSMTVDLTSVATSCQHGKSGKKVSATGDDGAITWAHPGNGPKQKPDSGSETGSKANGKPEWAGSGAEKTHGNGGSNGNGHAAKADSHGNGKAKGH